MIKQCQQCGTEFETDDFRRKYCSNECRKDFNAATHRAKYARRKAKKINPMRIKNDEQPIDNPVCLSCYHCGFCGYFRNCDYILDTGMPRGCPGGEECDKYTPRATTRKPQIVFGKLTEERQTK